MERSGHAVPPALLLPVQPGDRFIVHGNGNSLSLQCGNRRIHVTERESPFVVPASSSPPGFLSRLSDLLLDLGSRLTTQQAKSMTTVSTSSRGEYEPLSIPLLQDRTSHLVSEIDTLSLAWRGGTPPYSVQVVGTQPDGRPIAEQSSVQQVRTRLALIGPLPIGFMRVQVTDRDGSLAQGMFEVVPPARLPAIDPSLKDADIPKPLQTLLATDGMLKTNAAEWSFHAYQRVAPLAFTFEPARMLRDCLENPVPCYDR